MRRQREIIKIKAGNNEIETKKLYRDSTKQKIDSSKFQ
jgi:hypothetical protein